MSNKKTKATETPQQPKSSYDGILAKMSSMAEQYAFLGASSMLSAFSRAAAGMPNQPQIQNRRIKAISSLPADYTKEQIGEFLRNPYGNEIGLRQTSQVLKWTAYPYYKIIRTYQDIPSYRHYVKPLYIDGAAAKSKEFMREAILLDKVNKRLNPSQCAHRITGEAVTQGKAIYTLRAEVDKVHNRANYAFMQQLPQDWCEIIGYNSVSGYTVSFDMMYFLEPGTDWTQFGDLFAPYIDDFNRIFQEPSKDKKAKTGYVYCQRRGGRGNKNRIYPSQINFGGEGNPRIWEQNGRWMYYVSLPIDKVWVYEIDDTTPAVISPLSGLMLTYAQQSDYEAAQLSLLLNPLIKIFTGEIPYFADNGTQKEDGYRLSNNGRMLFETLFQLMMSQNNTGGTAFFSAPVANIKSHDFSESANANDISESFNRYGMEKAGLSALIPAMADVKASQVAVAQKLEAQYTSCIYRQFERMMNAFYASLNLKYDFEFVMFGDIFSDEKTRDALNKELATGDITAFMKLAALDGESWIDKLSALRVMGASGIMELLQVPQTAYTQSAKDQDANKGEAGRPTSDIDGADTTEAGDALEKSKDVNGEAVD